MADNTLLLDNAKQVLDINHHDEYTKPAKDLYPHQWLWDSCFIAIGLRNYDLNRSKKELISLLRGQWHNGMLPNIIFSNQAKYRPARNQWRSWTNPYAPDNVATSGITQPPMLAEAVVQVGLKMAWPERRLWYKQMYPALVSYHQWLYRERDPHSEGLVLQIHPWETGLDNTPPWMAELHEHLMPSWIRLIERLRLEKLINIFRTDTKKLPIEQRMAINESVALYDTQLRLRRKAYDINKILDHSLFTIEDLTFNSILIRANTHLAMVAKSIQVELPDDLKSSALKTKKSLEDLWDPYSSQYYSRDFVTHRLLKTHSIATLMPLYAGSISHDRAKILVKQIENQYLFGTAYPLPSVPASSSWFNQLCYWQGPTWVNTNWLVIQGLVNYGFKDHAGALAESTIEMISKSGFNEYFNPLTGEALGASNFSWTAALVIDLLSTNFD
jgi:hypothetical protein